MVEHKQCGFLIPPVGLSTSHLICSESSLLSFLLQLTFSCCSWLQSAVLKLLHFDPICLIHGKCIRFECCMEDLTCLTVTSWCLSALKTTKIRKKTQTLDFLLTTLFVQCLALRTSASLVTKWLKFSDPQGFFCTCLPSGICIVSVTNVH